MHGSSENLRHPWHYSPVFGAHAPPGAGGGGGVLERPRPTPPVRSFSSDRLSSVAAPSVSPCASPVPSHRPVAAAAAAASQRFSPAPSPSGPRRLPAPALPPKPAPAPKPPARPRLSSAAAAAAGAPPPQRPPLLKGRTFDALENTPPPPPEFTGRHQSFDDLRKITNDGSWMSSTPPAFYGYSPHFYHQQQHHHQQQHQPSFYYHQQQQQQLQQQRAMDAGSRMPSLDSLYEQLKAFAAAPQTHPPPPEVDALLSADLSALAVGVGRAQQQQQQ